MILSMTHVNTLFLLVEIGQFCHCVFLNQRSCQLNLIELRQYVDYLRILFALDA